VNDRRNAVDVQGLDGCKTIDRYRVLGLPLETFQAQHRVPQIECELPVFRQTVYVVDDDEAVRKSVCWLVETLGVGVETFPSAEILLSLCDGQLSGCLITDLTMSGLGGLDLLRELRRRGNEIPLIVLTAYGSVPAAVAALKQAPRSSWKSQLTTMFCWMLCGERSLWIFGAVPRSANCGPCVSDWSD